ncbi:MAG: NAD-binding protein [Kaiparowitsia implicata GSE-PSE-MK54-09C]|jgi:Trk K+ transport system NAD-binding subunit|nr:NAD-binding protein [Kaiparowitsia implicata GSE-PSE-MK54-09C]
MAKKPRIIVCGLGRAGHKVFCLLKQQGAVVVGINDRPLPQLEEDVIIGDLRQASTLIKAGIREADTLVLASSDDALNLAVLTQARVLNPDVRIINRLFNTSLGDRLDNTLPNHVSFSVAELAASVFAFTALGNRAIGQLKLFDQTWPIREEVIDADHPWLGRPLNSLWEDRNRMLIYYLPADSSTDLISAVLHQQVLQQGDRLILATIPLVRSDRRSSRERLSRVSIWLKQIWQSIGSTFSVLILLMVLIGGTTFIYTSVDFRHTFVDALYFAVGMITGAGGNEQVVEDSPDSIKVFTVVMMLLGTGIIGICYALLNDLVLGTRLKQLWQVVPPPRRNHYIVCGLGGVGIQTVRQLHHSGCDVVVIEQDPNNRFLNALRSLKVSIIHGDASLPSTLQEAHIREAKGLLAITSNDVINLEIALTAKGLVPKLPVVVRNQDPQFAPLAQRVFDFEAVLSPAELAAPSFAAAALGGRILGNGMAGTSLWVAIATLITSGHPFFGKTVKDAAMDTDFAPLYLETKYRAVHGWELLDKELVAGDVLYLTMPASRLELLWREDLAKAAAQQDSSLLDFRLWTMDG